MGRYLVVRDSVQRSVIALAFGAGLLAITQGATAAPVSLITLASAKFPSLTHAERALLEFAQVGNVERKDFAFSGA